MSKRHDRVRETLHSIVRLFESGNAPKALAVSFLPPPDIPASKWSLTNNLLLWISGTGDARGYRQWKEVDRYVRKGSKAIHILAPTFRKVGDDDEERDKPKRLSGFMPVPVFRFEDTEGEPIQYDLTPPELPPLIDVAESWGIEIKYVGCSGPYLGYYRKNEDRPDDIVLATHEEQVFLHELAHSSQYRTWPDINSEQKQRKEVAAELAACVLARLYGRKTANEGASYEYIKHFAEEEDKSLGRILWGIVSDTEKILRAIIDTHHNLETNRKEENHVN